MVATAQPREALDFQHEKQARRRLQYEPAFFAPVTGLNTQYNTKYTLSYTDTHKIGLGNRASCVEKFLKGSLADLQLSYVDMYLIHTPFAVPETEGEFQRDSDGDIILDSETSHTATWKVSIRGMSLKNRKIIKDYLFL